jgi:iron complex transport system substrate-binding protein
MLTSLSFRRLIYSIVLGILTAVLVSACNTITDTEIIANKPPAETCRTVQHRMGSTCVPRNPQRVVALAADSLANSWALGIRPIAATSVPGFPIPKYLQGKADQVESVGDFASPNIEKILKLKPDLIILGSNLQKVYKTLSSIAPTVVLNTPFPSPPWTDLLKELAQFLDKEEQGQQLIDQYWQRVEKLKQALGDRRKTMKVSIANTSSEYGIWSYGEKHFSGSVLKDTGLQRPESQRGDFFYIENLSQETLLSIDGDALFFASWGREDDKKTLEKLKQSPLWTKLNVVQNNQVYAVGGHWHNSDILAINAVLDDLENYLINTR